MFHYVINCMKDIFLGYIEIKCSNKKCNNFLTVSRNHKYILSDAELFCNIGCAFEIYKKETQNIDKAPNIVV